MLFFKQSIKAVVLVAILIFSSILGFTSGMSIDNGYGKEITNLSKPLDTLPLGTIQKNGNWIVNTTEIYQDTEIILTGNLIIKAGGILTFRNTTLILNCSIMKNPIWIQIKSGGAFRLWDSDNDPKSIEDRSILTDSTNDVDDGTVQDFRYFFRVEENGTLDVNNSLIEECGKYDGDEEKNTWGLYIEGDNATIRNSTIRNGDYLIILQHADNTLIEHVNITDALNYFIYSEYSNGTTIKNCISISPETYYGFNLRYSNDIKLKNNVISSLYRAFELDYLESVILTNNSATLSTTSTGFSTTEIDYCSNVTIEELNGNAKGKILKIYQSANVLLKNSDLSGKNMTPLFVNGLDIQRSDNITIENCSFRNCVGNGIYLTGSSKDDEDIIRVLNCTFENITREAIYFKNINNFIINNCTFKNTSKSVSYQALYLWYCYSGTVSNCEIEYSGGHDIKLWYSEEITIDNNIVGKYFRYYNGIDMYYADNNYITNNEFSYQAYGLEFYEANNNYIYNNQFIGWNDIGIGIDNKYSDNNVFINNYIQDYSTGINDYRAPGSKYKDINITSCTSSGFNGYESFTELENIYFNQNSNSIYSQFPGSTIAKNCSITNPINSDIYLRNGAKLTAINCTFKKSNIWLNGLTDNLFIGWWADIYVEDTNGFVPGALVTSYNNKDVREFSGLSGADGHVILPVIQEMLYRVGTIQTTDMNPHNITAYLYPDIANVTPKPTVTDNSNYTITFPGNTFPTPPQKLSTRSQSDDINLTWEYPALVDLQQFEIFRSLDPDVFNFNNPIGTAGKFYRSWEDTDAASDWKTYYYCIRANDTSGQLGNSSNLDRNGDWVVSAGNNQQFSNLNVELNGSILVESGGKLNLSNAKIKINHTEILEFGVRVQSGGILIVNDNDNDPDTLADASNITTNNASLPIYFIIESSGKLFMNNSIVFGIGHYSNEEETGLLISGSDSVIRNNTFIVAISSFYGLILLDVLNVKILGNKFELGLDQPFYMVNVKDSFIENNTIMGTTNHGIYSFEACSNNYYANNLIMNTKYGIYIRYGSSDKFVNNIFDNNKYGLYIRNSPNIVIFNNTFQNETTGYGIYVYDAPQSKFVENKAHELRIGIYISRARDILISSNQITNCTDYGFRIYDIPNSLFINNFVSNIDEIGIGFEENGDDTEEKVFVVGGNVTDCLYGIYVEYSSSFRFEGINCWNNLYGFYSDYSSYIHVNSSTFKDNFGIGVYSEGLGWSRTGSQVSYSTLLENCTLDNPYGMELGVEDGAIIWTVNISIPYNRINFKDGESMVAFFWYTHIYAEDMFGSPAANSMIKIQKVGGEFIEKSADGNGYLYWQLVHDITSLQDGNFTSNPYTIRATLGNHSGENITTIKGLKTVKVKLDNAAPNVVDPSMIPKMPYTSEDLVVTFGYSDPEGDPEFPRMIKWYADGVLKSNLANMTTIDKTNTAKGQIWFARIWVYDGAAYSEPTDTSWVTIQNTKPGVSNVKITPTTPSSSTDIVVSYTFNDVDSDSEGDSRIKWYRNGIDAGFSGNTLQSANTLKGEVWKAEVQPHDGDEYGTWVESNEITIGNTPPSVSTARILPANPMSNQTLNVSYVYYDLDSDLEGESTIKWFRNDIEQTELNGSKTVPPSNTKKGEKWKYLIFPSDGTDFGDPLESIPVTIGNTEPQVENIKILPENPTTADDLSVQYDFVDDDGDSESYETSVQWLRKRIGDVDFAYTGLQVRTLSSIYTVKNEVWICEVTPHDSIAYGETFRAEVSVTILNSAPIAKDTSIEPSVPTTKDELKANYVFSDIDSDLESGSEIKWFRNGVEIIEFNNKLSISSKNTAKGQIWYFIIRPSDGQDYGVSIKSSNITIHNSPPTAKDVKILPNSPTGNDDLFASYSYYDGDGDNESAPEIMWFENGIHQPEFDNQQTVNSEAVEKGENWHFEIRVFDGIDFSERNSSNHPKIRNTMATAKSITPEAITAKTVLINETESQSFQINAEDPDGDLILYYWRLDGQLVSQDYFYTFTTDHEGEHSAGRYNLSLEFREFTETELSIIDWEIVVLDVNRPPKIESWSPVSKHSNLVEEKSLTFSVSATDPDKDDIPNFIWYFDETPVPGQRGSSYAYTGKESDIGEHKIKVEVLDIAGAKDEYFWNITVKQKDEGEYLMGQTYDWWGLVVAIITSIIGASLFLFGFFRMRKKKSKLREYLDQIEEITESEKDSHEKEVQLKKLKGQIRKEFSQELIIENHYLILVQHVDNAIGEIRTSLLEERVAMPEELRGDVEEVLGDGVVTRDEYNSILNRISATKEMTTIEKSKLTSMLSRWMIDGKREEKMLPRKDKDNDKRRNTIGKGAGEMDDDKEIEKEIENDSIKDEMGDKKEGEQVEDLEI